MESRNICELGIKKELNVEKVKISYFEKGEGDVIILLNGWPQTSYMWRKITTPLSKKFRIIAVDLPGLGNSENISSYDTKNIATLLNNFRNILKIEKFHLIGHDIGSWIASTYFIYFNKYLKSLTVLDAGIPGLIPEEVFSLKNSNKIWQFYFHKIDEIPEFLIKGKEKEYISWYFNKKSFIKNSITNEDIEEYYSKYKQENVMRNSFEYYKAFEKSAEQNKIAINKFPTKILAIGGEFAMAENVGIAMEKLSYNVTTKVIKNCAHYIAEEQPNELVEILINWL
jgi:pimeloyl-ACP methyl ester carboxylesterase